ncbi:hypothetical protein [Pseudarthrobacter sp. GA104]|uniref:hypothetical protein n=1 Tax=Pseudarthrobacter sp. GA104 TaxID=2676311 RepID=UPI0012FC1956|nr:hypothetical protein [Pseudarthrobacter sp. GA104]MUU73399.1 hypothetical protein [Pseudarthrobacter sp. GA104]
MSAFKGGLIGPMRALPLEGDVVFMLFAAVPPVEHELRPAQQVAAFVDECPELDTHALLPLGQ